MYHFKAKSGLKHEKGNFRDFPVMIHCMPLYLCVGFTNDVIVVILFIQSTFQIQFQWLQLLE